VRRLIALVGAICLSGYALYGRLYVAGVALNGALAGDSPGPIDGGRSDDRTPVGWHSTPGGTETGDAENDSNDCPPFSFERVYTGFNCAYKQTGVGNNVLVSQAGAYVTDHDRDRWPDVLLVSGDRPVLYKNQEGSLERSDALPTLNRTANAALFFDYNGDRRDDLLLLTAGRAPLLLRNADGTFERVGTVGDPFKMPPRAAAADFDDDGCLDIFAYQYGNWNDRLLGSRTNYSAPLNNNGNPDRLYWGTCDGLEPANETALGIQDNRWILATIGVDLTGDE